MYKSCALDTGAPSCAANCGLAQALLRDGQQCQTIRHHQIPVRWTVAEVCISHMHLELPLECYLQLMANANAVVSCFVHTYDTTHRPCSSRSMAQVATCGVMGC